MHVNQSNVALVPNIQPFEKMNIVKVSVTVLVIVAIFLLLSHCGPSAGHDKPADIHSSGPLVLPGLSTVKKDKSLPPVEKVPVVAQGSDAVEPVEQVPLITPQALNSGNKPVLKAIPVDEPRPPRGMHVTGQKRIVTHKSVTIYLNLGADAPKRVRDAVVASSLSRLQNMAQNSVTPGNKPILPSIQQANSVIQEEFSARGLTLSPGRDRQPHCFKIMEYRFSN